MTQFQLSLSCRTDALTSDSFLYTLQSTTNFSVYQSARILQLRNKPNLVLYIFKVYFLKCFVLLFRYRVERHDLEKVNG